MALPKNLTKEHLLKAIEKIDKEGFPADSDSQYYDVIYKEKRYPPKVVVSYANLFANGELLDRDSFDGGLNTPCFKLLEDNGFTIITKGEDKNKSYFDQLIEFLSVAKKQVIGKGTTAEATTLERTRTKAFQNLQVNLSFGAGRATSVPWISFLRKGQLTKNGIYPVYLFYKKNNLLILAYGVSEGTKPSINWDLPDSRKIEHYFLNKNLGKPDHYAESFVFRTYDTEKPLNKELMDQDLLEIINIYKGLPLNSEETEVAQKEESFSTKESRLKSKQQKLEHSTFYNACSNANFFISEKLALRFIASLLTKPFVILTGLSGSGKTKLAQAFAWWICENNDQYCIVPVGADWTNREPLLGFPNALNSIEYIKPDNQVLDTIIAASKNPDKPYFLILDEMNLSHVERYFADFLSVMESNGSICLHTGNENHADVPPDICLSKNLFIIGTVNIDETTYMFSPKVLDRANVIEFRVTADEMESYLNNNKPLDLNTLKSAGDSMAEAFVRLAIDRTIVATDTDGLNNTLISFFRELKKTGAEFGYRTAAEILRFAAIVNIIERNWTMNEIIDAAIMQKLLPKVHGARRKLEPVLNTLGKLCLQEGESIDDFISKKEINFKENKKIKYPLSFEKIQRMLDNLTSNGFTSYAEA